MQQKTTPDKTKDGDRTNSVTLTPLETRTITRFGIAQTYRMLRSGQMPSIQVGRRFYIPRAALLKWIESCGGQVEG